MCLQAFVPQLSTLPKLNKFTPYNLAKSIRKFPRPKYSRSYATVPVMCVCVCVLRTSFECAVVHAICTQIELCIPIPMSIQIFHFISIRFDSSKSTFIGILIKFITATKPSPSAILNRHFCADCQRVIVKWNLDLVYKERNGSEPEICRISTLNHWICSWTHETSWYTATD